MEFNWLFDDVSINNICLLWESLKKKKINNWNSKIFHPMSGLCNSDRLLTTVTPENLLIRSHLALLNSEIVLSRASELLPNIEVDLSLTLKNTRKFDICKELLEQLHPRLNRIFESVVEMVIPTRFKSKINEGIGLSTFEIPGAIFINLDAIPDIFNLLLSMVHESAHQVLMIYQHGDPIIKGDILTPVFSGIRQMNRPAILAFHAIFAMTYMSELISKSLEFNNPLFKKEDQMNIFVDVLNKIYQTLISLKKNCEFTDIGGRILNSIENEYFKKLGMIC